MALATTALLWIGASPGAMAGVEGPCTAFFNGVAVSDIDDLASPLLLRADDMLVFHGTDDPGTTSASVAVILAPITVDSASTDFGPAQQDFAVELDLAEMSPYAVGLFRIRGVTDNCVAEAWVRLTDRFPFTTLAGITAGGLALGGLAGQLTSIATRRRWSPTVAGLSGIATGVGGALVGQQFGRLQLSYVSIGISVAAAIVIGVTVALMLRPRDTAGGATHRRAEPSQKRRIRRQARSEAARLHAARLQAEEDAILFAEEQAMRRAEDEIRRRTDEEIMRRADETRRAEEMGRAEEEQRAGGIPGRAEQSAGLEQQGATQRSEGPAAEVGMPVSAPPPLEGPAWCYVMASVDVVDLTDHTRIVGALTPGTWYLAKRQVGNWAHVVVGEGTEGWVPATSIHRQG